MLDIINAIVIVSVQFGTQWHYPCTRAVHPGPCIRYTRAE